MTRILLFIVCILMQTTTNAQVVMKIKSVNIDYNVEDKSDSGGQVIEFVYSEPRVKISLVIVNHDLDSVSLSIPYNDIQNGMVRYVYDRQDIKQTKHLFVNSDELILSTIVIPPKTRYEFAVSFIPRPIGEFTKENYYSNIWKILPTLQFILKQKQPERLYLTTEPFEYITPKIIYNKGITINNSSYTPEYNEIKRKSPWQEIIDKYIQNRNDSSPIPAIRCGK